MLKQNQTTEQSGSELLTVPEAAHLLRLKVSTIRAWVLYRRIPFVKLGGKRVFFRRQDLEALVAASVVPAKVQRGRVSTAQPDRDFVSPDQ